MNLFQGVVSYKVRWKGYGSEEDTWEPVDNLDSCQDLVDDFNKKREESMRQKAEERKLRQVFKLHILTVVQPSPIIQLVVCKT